MITRINLRDSVRTKRGLTRPVRRHKKVRLVRVKITWHVKIVNPLNVVERNTGNPRHRKPLPALQRTPYHTTGNNFTAT